MGLVWVREQWSKRSGSGDESSLREYTRSWLVLRDSTLDDAYTVLQTSGLPGLFGLYIGSDGVADNLGALLRKLEAHQPDAEQPFLWEVVGRYSNKIDPQLGEQNPLNRPTEISGDFDGFQVPLVMDQYGTPVLTSSQEQFDPPIEKDDSRRTLVMVRNELTAPDDLAATYQDTCNSDTWMGQPAYCWKCRGIKYQRTYENNVLYWKCTSTFHLNPKTWAAQVLDRGTRWIDASGTSHKFLYMGSPDPNPQLLNGEGAPLGKGQPGQDGAQSTLSGAIGQADKAIQFHIPTGIGFPSLSATYPIVIRLGTAASFELVQCPTAPPAALHQWKNVVRGFSNTTAQAWPDQTPVAMQPYYRTFFPYVQLPFGNLKLP